MDTYEVGSKVWFHGYEYTIIDEPFKMYGGMMQRARRDDGYSDGTTICIPTPEQKAADTAQIQKEYADQQAGFRRLKAL